MTLTESPSLLVAGIGEMVLSSSPDAHLVAYGLGSCIALAVWDPRTKVGGLAHFMLPNGPANSGSPVKFIDTGLDEFLHAVEAKGAVLGRCIFKAAGAAAESAGSAQGALRAGWARARWRSVLSKGRNS